MARSKNTRAARRAKRGGVRVMRRNNMAPMVSPEARLLKLIADPCGAELVHGFATSMEGVVQRFNRFITPAATTETAFAYIFNPASHIATGGAAAITQKLAVGTGAPTNVQTGGPGEAFLEANSDYAAPLAACVEVLYTGKLVDRQGYIGVCQVNAQVALDIASGTTDLPTLLTYCQHVAPVPSHSVEVKWSPSIRNFTSQNATSEGGSSTQDNCIIVVAVGVEPSKFVAKFTTVYEYLPKFTLGLPAPRVTKTIPVGAGERIVSALDRAGTWWHNLGNAAAAAYRMGGSAIYAAGQVGRTVRAAQSALGPATALLALTG